MSEKINIIIFFLIYVLFTSCSHYYYTPNSQTSPLFKEKGEARISAAHYGSEESTGFVMNSALAITDNIGLIGNFMYGDDEDNDSDGKGNFSEIGIGLFIPENNNSVFEVYGGFGIGNVKNHYSNDLESKLSFHRYFIQPSVGYRSNIVEFAFSSRFCLVHYNKFGYDYLLKEFHHITDIRYIIDNKNFLMMEPAATIRLGAEKFKIQFQLIRSIPYNHKLKQEEVNLNIGFIIQI